jgi:cell division transport system permease protein
MKLPKSFDSDFNFDGDKTNKFIQFILGFLMYSVTLAGMSCLFTHNLTSEWSRALNGHITIEFQSNIDGTDETLTSKQIDEVVDIVKTTKGIKSITKLDESDILRILEPWLSSTSIPDDFPFPTIFDVETEKDARVDLLLLTEKLSKISSGVKIHDHANWYVPIMRISNGLFFFSILLSVLVFLTVCITMIFITKKTITTHENVVKILQLIGASSSYIASQFKKYFFFVSLKSSMISIAFGAATILAASIVASTSVYSIENLKYIAILFAIPLISTAVVVITSRNSAMFFLHNNKWVG